MTQPRPRPEFERRHPGISHEELRRQLIDADQDRYRLQNELAAVTAPHVHAGTRAATLRRRVAIGAGIVIVTGLAGGLVWQMCPPAVRADARSAVQLQTVTVTPRIVSSQSADVRQVAMKPRIKSPVKRYARPLPASRVDNRLKSAGAAHARAVPRPLSPGEFGRPRAAY
jgi:hypothetical protein